MGTQSKKSFPNLYVKEKEKTEEWCENIINAIVNYISTDNSIWEHSRMSDIKNYNLYNGDLDLNDFKYITEQYGMAFPARMVHYPIIQPKIDLLCGEELRRPLDMKVSSINKEAALRKQDYKVSLAMKQLLDEIHKEMEDISGMSIDMEADGIPMPEDLEKYMQYDYKEAVEEVAQDGLEYLMQKYSFKELFKSGFRDLLVTGKEFYQVNIKGGDPFVRRVDPRNVVYDVSMESDYLENAQWVGEERWLTPNEVMDEYRDELSKKNIEELNEVLSISSVSDLSDYNKDLHWVDWDNEEGLKIRVVFAEWKSIRSIKMKVSDNRYDASKPFYKVVGEDYQERKGDKFEKKYVDDIWQGTKIGGKVLIQCKRRDNQVRSVDDPGKTPLSFVGLIRNHSTGNSSSMCNLLKNVQYLYNIVMYHIELALARSGGKAVVYDVAQLPTNLGMDMQTVLYHLKTDGVIPINSKEEGNQLGNFTQFQQIDFTLSSSVQQLINLKLMLEQTAGQISGVSPQREGAVEQYEYVGNVQRSVVQSATITESWFHSHNVIKKQIFERLCNLMKVAWLEGKKASYVLGDGAYKLLNVFPDIALQDYGVYVGDSGKDDAMKQVVTQLAQAALQNQQIEFLDLVKVLKAESMTEAEKILEIAMKTMKQQQQQAQQQQQQLQQMEAEAKAQEHERAKELAAIDSETKVKVAEISAEARVDVAEIDADQKRDIADMKEKVGLMKDKKDQKTSGKIEGKSSRSNNVNPEQTDANREDVELTKENIK